MSLMLWICTILIIGLTAYSLVHYFCVLVFLRGLPAARKFEGSTQNSVAILIPARNEGEGAMRAIRSALDQDHGGPIEIYLLVKDHADSSMQFLKKAFPEAHLTDAPAYIVELYNKDNRKVFVAFTGDDSKSAKLNWMAERLNSDFLAILDSDHQAHSAWIRSSLILMNEKKARIIQGWRGPLSAPGFFQLWDSLHQHIGCEMFNTAFARLNLTLFITGTTVVMQTGLLQKNKLSECVTEDVEFSYRILLQGEKIIYNPYYGSDEEVSPDMYSFIARRRRWANGHTGAFFDHLRGIYSAPLKLRDRIQFVFHGLHYLVALFVFALHLDIGLILMQKMSPISQLTALLSSFILSAMITKTQRSPGFGARFSEIAIVFAWIFPAILILLSLALAYLASDITQAALPIPGYLQVLGLIGLCAPLVVLLAGLAGFRQLNLGTLLWVLLTYPIAFYLDVAAVLIGLVDYITSRKYWHAVARSPQKPDRGNQTGEIPDVPAAGIKASLGFSSIIKASRMTLYRFFAFFLKPSRAAALLALSGLLFIGIMYTPSLMIPVAAAPCEALKHDTDPWIVPAKKIPGYCESSPARQKAGWSKRTGSYHPVRQDDLRQIDPAFWEKLDSTFFCNQAAFTPDNVVLQRQGGVGFQLRREQKGDKAFTSGSIATKDSPEAHFLYGRFETVMKPIKVSGVVSALFLYRFDPWQEIDMEFVGRDTTRILLNVYYNPGNPGDLYNYGYRGTPVLVDLGFDAADDFHRYAIEWDPEEIRWFVDDRLIHRRRAGYPTPIPHLPMRFFLNTWPTCSEELAGPFLPTGENLQADFKSVAIYKWKAAPLPWLSSFVDGLFSSSEPGENWRKKAEWIQPGPSP
ncbi:MAG: family 16 glycosylhydrolase [Spirochaetales bacterium]|nr:family 16 glycosylhydrolase [Spirochaetales bacterium]